MKKYDYFKNSYIFDSTKPQTMETYTERISQLTLDINADIRPLLSKGVFDAEINYHRCTVSILGDDGATIWVNWGPYDCELEELPARAMATVVDNILRAHEM